jgi:hypothetical protein
MNFKMCLLLMCSFSTLQNVLAEELKPIMVKAGKQVLTAQFSQDGPLKKAQFKSNQGTRWVAKKGVLFGQQSSPKFQAKKKDHKGLEPRMSCPVTPKEFIAKFSIRFIDGKATKIVPFVEFGHHIVRLRIQKVGIDIVADYESMQLAKAPFVWEMGEWYHCLAELKGEEFVIQIQNGPTLYAKHQIFTQPNPSGGNGLGVAGARGGFIEMDNITFWEAGGEQPTWQERQKKFPEYTPVKVREKPDKTKKKK